MAPQGRGLALQTHATIQSALKCNSARKPSYVNGQHRSSDAPCHFSFLKEKKLKKTRENKNVFSPDPGSGDLPVCRIAC
jgi:hypothetical protein